MVALDFSGKRGQATVATTVDSFVSDIVQVERLRPHTVRAYRYELAAAAADARFQCPLDELPLEDLDSWLTRAPAATSTVERRVASFRRFFGWACRHGRCTRNPLADRAPLHGRRRLPRPIREHLERRVLDAAIGTAPQPYRLIFTLLRETGMRVGPSRVTTTCWQCGQAGMLAHATTTRQRRKFQVGESRGPVGGRTTLGCGAERRVITDKAATYPACPRLGRAGRIASNRAVPNEWN